MWRKISFKAKFFKEEDVYVSLCPELNLSNFGDDLEEAKKSLAEAVEAFLEECERMGTLNCFAPIHLSDISCLLGFL